MSDPTIQLRGAKAWMEDFEGNTVPVTRVQVNGNRVACEVGLHRKLKYRIHWAKALNSQPLHAWCEVYRISPTGKDKTNGAAAHMDRADQNTQKWDSEKCLNEDNYPNGFVAVQSKSKHGKGFGKVSLEIWRAKPGKIGVTRARDIDAAHMNLIDPQDSPWIVFIFQLQIIGKQEYRNRLQASLNVSSHQQLSPISGVTRTGARAPETTANARQRADVPDDDDEVGETENEDDSEAGFEPDEHETTRKRKAPQGAPRFAASKSARTSLSGRANDSPSRAASETGSDASADTPDALGDVEAEIEASRKADRENKSLRKQIRSNRLAQEAENKRMRAFLGLPE